MDDQSGHVTIEASAPGDLDALEGFLRETSGAPLDARWCAADVLRWKYFDGRAGAPLSYLARREGRVVGHIGLVRRSLDVPDGDRRRSLTGVHFIDWAVALDARAAGALLLLRGLSGVDVAYLLGGSSDGKAVSQAAGFAQRPAVPVFERVLRPWYRLGSERPPRWRNVAAGARDLVRRGVARPTPPRLPVALERCAELGEQAASILAAAPRRMVYPERSVRLLNHYLRCPVGEVTAFLARWGGQPVGVVMLTVVTTAGVRLGRVVECLVASESVEAWHATMCAVVAESERQRVDVISSYGSTEVMQRACAAAGLRRTRLQPFFVRDRTRLLPDIPMHITHIEADHALFH